MGNNPPENRHSDGHAALASVVFRAAWAIIFSSSAYAVQFAYIPCDDGTVKVINVATHSVVKTLNVGGAPVGVAVSPALHQVFVTNSGDDSISVIDTPGTDTASDSVKPPIGVGGGPQGVAVSPDGTRIYVTNFTGNSVTVIDGNTGGFIKTITEADGIGILPLGVVVSPDGALVYVANNGVTNTISVIDAATNTVQPTAISIGGVSGAGPAGLVINPAGTVLYATKLAGNIVAVIDTKTLMVKTINVGTHPAGIAMSHDGTRVYVANLGSANELGTVSVIDTATNAVIPPLIQVGMTPEGIDVGRGGKKVFVANNGSNNVSVIDTTSKKVATIPLGACAPEGFGTFIREGFTPHPVHH